MSLSFFTAAVASHEMSAWGQFTAIIGKPDNMPVAGALLLVGLFTWIAMRQALKNDRLIREGRKDEILDDMQS